MDVTEEVTHQIVSDSVGLLEYDLNLLSSRISASKNLLTKKCQEAEEKYPPPHLQFRTIGHLAQHC